LSKFVSDEMKKVADRWGWDGGNERERILGGWNEEDCGGLVM